MIKIYKTLLLISLIFSFPAYSFHITLNSNCYIEAIPYNFDKFADEPDIKIKFSSYAFDADYQQCFFKREMHERIGLYSTKYKIAGDFDFIVRLFQNKDLTYTSCDKVFIKMQAGGLSDKFSNKILLQKELLEICRVRNIKTNHFLLLLRYLIKLPEVIPKLARINRFFKQRKNTISSK